MWTFSKMSKSMFNGAHAPRRWRMLWLNISRPYCIYSDSFPRLLNVNQCSLSLLLLKGIWQLVPLDWMCPQYHWGMSSGSSDPVLSCCSLESHFTLLFVCTLWLKTCMSACVLHRNQCLTKAVKQKGPILKAYFPECVPLGRDLWQYTWLACTVLTLQQYTAS